MPAKKKLTKKLNCYKQAMKCMNVPKRKQQ